jgi:hypothetical protein
MSHGRALVAIVVPLCYDANQPGTKGLTHE